MHEATGVGLIAGNHGAFRSPEASDAYICRECAELAVEILTGNAGG